MSQVATPPPTDQLAAFPAESFIVIVFVFLIYLLGCGAIAAVFNFYKIDPPQLDQSTLEKVKRSRPFWMRLLFIVMGAIFGGMRIVDTCGPEPLGADGGVDYCGNWHLMFWYSLALIVTANVSMVPFEFYLGEGISFVDQANFFLFNKKLPTSKELEEASFNRWVKGQGGEEVSQGEATNQAGSVGFTTLMPSVFISWIFAKSIRNSAWLGGRYGILGGVAYTSWYLSFFTTGIVCYRLRTRYNFKSLPTAVYKNYGAVAVIIFQLCLFFRLFNEVWSNAGVIGGFYGSTKSPGYWGAAWFSVLVPTVYVIMGGMRASLVSDVLQAFLGIAFLVVVLGAIASDKTFSDNTDAFSYTPGDFHDGFGLPAYFVGGWDEGWWACTLAGSIQGIISYPFFDPVLTDRGFLGTPKTMLASMLVGGLLAALFILFFSILGVYGTFYKEHYEHHCQCSDENRILSDLPNCPEWNPCPLMGSFSEASTVARILGYRTFGAVEVFVNFIMITASMSTLDSTFTSVSKLVSLEFCGWLNLDGDRRSYPGPLRPPDLDNIGYQHITVARCTMAFLAVAGTGFLGIEGDVMQATTAAGTCVMGIGAPIWFMCIWQTKEEGRRGWRQAPLAFIVPTIVGFVFGLSYWSNGRDGEGWTYDMAMGESVDGTPYYYSRFLGTNFYGHIVVVGLFFVFFAFHQVLGMMGVEFFPEVTPESDRGTIIGKKEGEEVKALSPKNDDGATTTSAI